MLADEIVIQIHVVLVWPFRVGGQVVEDEIFGKRNFKIYHLHFAVFYEFFHVFVRINYIFIG
jgi:hypothetical protein